MSLSVIALYLLFGTSFIGSFASRGQIAGKIKLQAGVLDVHDITSRSVLSRLWNRKYALRAKVL